MTYEKNGKPDNVEGKIQFSSGVKFTFAGVFAIGIVIVLFAFAPHDPHGTQLRTTSPFFDIKVEDATGNVFQTKNIMTHPGGSSDKLYLITNLASNCGLTHKNYPELQTLYSRYQDRGLEVWGFPCNDFKEQEPGTNEDIQLFAKAIGATFPVFGKVRACSGESMTTHPLFKYLIANSPTETHQPLRWNFEKFLVDGRNGKVLKRFHPKQNPLSFEGEIVEILDSMQGM